jgi:hypothetical protein
MDWNLLDAMRFLGECLLMLAATALVMGLIGLIMVGGAVLAAKLTAPRDFSGFRITCLRLVPCAGLSLKSVS